jgi:hypothetical protein
MFSFRETVFSGKNAISKNVEEQTCHLPNPGRKMPVKKKRVTKSTCNAIIESFSKAGSTTDQKWDFLV